MLLGPATALAGRTGASVSLVMSSGPGPEVHSARRYLETRVFALQTAGPDIPSVEVNVVYDRRPAESILMMAGQIPDSLVCMSTHGRSGVGALVFGSVAEAVVRGACRPLILVGPECRSAPPLPDRPRLVVCVDGSALSRTVIDPAVDLAKMIGAEIAVVHAIEPIIELVPSPVLLDPIEPEVPELEAIATELAARGLHASWELLGPREAGAAIVEYAGGAHPADFIAIRDTRPRRAQARRAGEHRLTRRATRPVPSARAPPPVRGSARRTKKLKPQIEASR